MVPKLITGNICRNLKVIKIECTNFFAKIIFMFGVLLLVLKLRATKFCQLIEKKKKKER